MWPIPVDSGQLGVRADSAALEGLVLPQKNLSRTGKSVSTFNGFGFDIQHWEPTWVIEESLRRMRPGRQMLDVGAGFGGITSRAINLGATVIANDLDWRHLLWIRHGVAREQRDRLYLNLTPVEGMSLPENSCDLILAHRVLHFFSGTAIDSILTKFRRWSKRGALLGIVTMSASHILYRERFLHQYQRRKADGCEWPGEWLDVATNLPSQSYALPSKLHVFEPDDLAVKLDKFGFEVIQKGHISVTSASAPSEPKNEGRQHTGVLARRRDS